MVGVSDPSWTDLAEAVRRRRLQLGLSATSAAGSAGINRATWATIEAGKHKLSERLWPGVEQALAWAPGSIDNVLQGRDPTPVARTLAGTATANLDPLTAAATVIPAGFDLVAEVDRIKALDIPTSTKIKLVQAMVELYEQSLAEQRAQARR